MTQYATAAEFRSLGIAAAAVAGYTDGQIDGFLQTASEWADGYLRSRYSLPLTSWSRDLKIAVCQYAKYLLLDHRGVDPNDPTGTTTQMALRQAERFWDDVNAGKRTLQVVGTAPTARPAAVVYSSPRRGW